MDESTIAGGRSTLAAVLARLLPPGAGPGAIEAGAVDYVAMRLEGDLEAAVVRDGLDLLDRLACHRYGTRFAALAPPRQDEILKAFEVDSGSAGAHALHRLVLLALEGSFCHPARGGNRRGAGWRFAGLDAAAAAADRSSCRGR